MLLNTQGIVFHTIKYGDTSLIVKIYTRELGLVSYIVNGVRTPKSRLKAPLLHPPNLLDMVSYHRENKNLQRLREFKPAYVFQSIPFDTVKSTVSLFLLEVMTKCIREHEPNPDKYDFIAHSFEFMDQVDKLDPKFHHAFLLKMTKFLGITPQHTAGKEVSNLDVSQGSYSAQVPQHPWYIPDPFSRYFQDLSEASYLDLGDIRVAKAERKQLLEHILNYYRWHMEGMGELKSPAILQEVLG